MYALFSVPFSRYAVTSKAYEGGQKSDLFCWNVFLAYIYGGGRISLLINIYRPCSRCWQCAFSVAGILPDEGGGGAALRRYVSEKQATCLAARQYLGVAAREEEAGVAWRIAAPGGRRAKAIVPLFRRTITSFFISSYIIYGR
jgi:hypothetical protein